MAMFETSTITTSRLTLRPWRDGDLEPFARLNADRNVMRFMRKTLDRAESDRMVADIRAHFGQHGWGPWAVEVPGVARFAGMVGLALLDDGVPFAPCVEVAWRFDPAFWGRGYATEGAEAALQFGFERLGLDEIVAMSLPANRRSIAVMERLGMGRSAADDFERPGLPGRPSRLHVLYRIDRNAWCRRAGALSNP